LHIAPINIEQMGYYRGGPSFQFAIHASEK